MQPESIPPLEPVNEQPLEPPAATELEVTPDQPATPDWQGITRLGRISAFGPSLDGDFSS